MNAWPTCWINWPTTIPDEDVASTRGALQTAASKLRAAVNKAQALSAISQCRALIAGALANVRAIGGGHVQGWGGGSGAGIGLEAIVGRLGRAAKLIQKGVRVTSLSRGAVKSKRPE